MLIKYLRRKGRRVRVMNEEGISYERLPGEYKGLVVCDKIDGEIRIGWSLCCKKDRFNKRVAFTKATGRLNSKHEAPPSIKDDIEEMKHRAELYFKV